jgi:hypothetical protein
MLSVLVSKEKEESSLSAVLSLAAVLDSTDSADDDRDGHGEEKLRIY